MNLGRLRARRLREWVVLLLLPVVAFRLFVPAGFMPSFGDGFEVSMQMCHGDAQSSVVVRLTGGPRGHGDGPDAHHDAPCVFAASASVAPPATPVAPLHGAAAPEALPAPRSVAPDTATPHRPQSPRAPPSFV